MTLKEQHDQLLLEKPEEANHDAEGCPFCNLELNINNDNSIGGGDMKTYTEEDFTSAVQEAVAPLQAAADARVSELQLEIEELRTTQAQSEIDGQVAEVQADLDKAEVRVAEAERKYDDLVAYLIAEATAVTEAANLEALRETRREAVKQATALSDEVIDQRLDRWVAMDDDSFEAVLEDWKALSAASRETEEASEASEIPRETAMSNIREHSTSGSVASEVFGARNAGVDVRYL
jgi:hypothetical protein